MDHISLNSNNHNSNLVNSLDHFKAVNSFVDVTLVCEGHTVKAHKIILSAGSNVLHRLLLANPAKHPILILAETKYDTLRMILDFLYKGRIDVPKNDLRKLLAVAVTFEMNELKRICEESLNNKKDDSELSSHPYSKSPNLSGSSPKKKRQRIQSSDSDVLYDAIFPKREISYSPCSLEQPEISPLTDTLQASAQTECVEFRPEIADTRSLNKTSMEVSTANDLTVECSTGNDLTVESSTRSDLTVACIQNIPKKDASTECDIQPLKELKSNLVPIEPARVRVRPMYIEKSDDSESDSQNKLKFLMRRRRAAIWKYFTAVNSSYAVCKLCRGKLSYKTTVTNLTKHLQKKHQQFDPKHPPKLPDLPLLTIQREQLEIFEEIDFNSVEEEAVQEDDEHLQYEEDLDEGIPSTSTPCILKIT